MTMLIRFAARAAKALSASDVLPRDGETVSAGKLERAIRLLIVEEHKAVAFYRAVAESAGDELAQAVLESIAAEEVVHIGELQRLLSLLDVDGGEDAGMDKGAIETNGMAGIGDGP